MPDLVPPRVGASSESVDESGKYFDRALAASPAIAADLVRLDIDVIATVGAVAA